MDSSGVRLLDTLMREAERQRLDADPRPALQPAVRRVLELTGMLELLPFEPRWRPAASAMSVLARNNVVVHGPPDGRPMLFAHGFGCDQNMWRFVWPAFADDYRVVLFDHVGAGGSDLSAYDPERYGTLAGLRRRRPRDLRGARARPTSSSSATRSAR